MQPDVLIADRRTSRARALAGLLERKGFRVYSCVEDDASLSCAALAGRRCPLDAAPVDVALAIPGAADSGTDYGDGSLCAVRRRIPLVLLTGEPGHRLAPWAAATATDDDVVSTLSEVLRGPAPGHTGCARKALLHELRDQGAPSEAATVEVHRRPGRLVVELSTDSTVSRTQAERIAAHLAQAVRLYDPWAPKLDVTVRALAEPEPVTSG